MYAHARTMERPVSHCNKACFGLQNGTLRKPKRHVTQLAGSQAIDKDGLRGCL